MKTLNRLNDGTWEQINLVPMSEETKAILSDEDASDEAKHEALIAYKNESTKVADVEDSKDCEALFQKHFITDHIFIDAIVWLPSKSGLINCRNAQNLEHCQIRF